jgi:CubicO group peptidase (beta-lactamase class C family)
MNKLSLLIITILVFSVFGFCQKAVQLKTDEQLEVELGPEDSNVYNVSLKKDHLCYAILEQKGIDIIIKVTDPNGKEIGSFDTPNGQQGPEQVIFTSETAGDYKIEVKPFDKMEPLGNYTIKVILIEPLADSPEKRIDQLFIPWDDPTVPGASIAVSKKGKILYSTGYGAANLEYDVPNSPSTIFHIASISKQFTAFSVTMLADQGKLSLDDDIRKYIPEVPDFGEKITLKHLIHHTSGLRDQWNLLAMAGWRLDDVITREQILRLISHQQALNFKPGEEYLYCNTGYTLLAETVSRVTGESFSEWTKINIFEPLDMRNTLFYDDHEKIVKNRAYSYSVAPNGYKKNVLSYANVGATSLFTTVEDLSKWAWNFEDIKVGNPQIMAQMDERGILNKGDTIGYAFGQGIGEYKGLATRRHGGADAGYRTHLLRFPEQQVDIVVLSNLGSFNTSRKANEIADIYLKDTFDDTTDEEIKEKEEDDKPEEFDVSAELIEEYCGRYELQPGFILSFSLDGGKFIAQATGQTQVNLIAKSETEFFVPEGPATIIFERNEEKQVSQLTLLQGGQEMVAPRMAPFDASEVNLEELTGKFYSEELQTMYEFVIKNDTLIAQHQRHDDITFTQSKKDACTGNVWFFRQVEFVRDNADKITGCKVSSGRVRDVWFYKMN